MTRKLELYLASTIGIVSALNLVSYFTKPDIPEAEMLKTTSVYVQRYENESVKDTLDYVQSILKVAKRNYELSEDIRRLEKEFSLTSKTIEQSINQTTHKKVLREFGDRMKTIADKNRRNPLTLGLGIVGCLVSLLWLTDPENYRKNE